MDMRMPVVDGYEATRRIRSAPGGAAPVIIAVTASALEERMPAMMEAGVDDLVFKPFKEGLLFDKIGTLLDVKYRYEAPGEFTNAPICEPVSLSELPADLSTRMREAILGCDMDGFIQLLPQVAEVYPSAAVGLRTLADKYDYDSLSRIVSESQLRRYMWDWSAITL
jgi:CheY-like chemotaxis protein